MTSCSKISPTWRGLSFADRIRSLESIAADNRSTEWEQRFTRDLRTQVLSGKSLTLYQIHKLEDLLGRAARRPTKADQVRVEKLAEKIHELGPQPLAYLFKDIGATTNIRPLLERYAALPADFIREMGGDRKKPCFLVIEGGRHG
jgi:hypothetical protein